MKKLISILFIFSVLTFSCSKCPPYQKYFDIEGVHLVNAFKQRTLNDTTNTNLLDSIKFKNFALSTDFSISYYSAIKQNSFSFIPAAYALSCPDDGEGGTKEKIAAIDLIALTDYNENYKAGDHLNDIIKIDGLPVSNFIEGRNKYGINSYGFDIELTQKPDSTTKKAFKLVFKLDNGEIHNAESKPIIIF